MSVLPIVLWPDPLLSQVCAPVGPVSGEIETLVGDMFETMYAAPGRGLAAPQVGVMARLFVMDATWKDGDMTPLVCIDPEIRPMGATLGTHQEACLSIPGVAADVTRPAQIEMRYTDLTGQRCTVQMDGFAAVCAQHELDHLDGRVIFDHLDAEARADLQATYRAAP